MNASRLLEIVQLLIDLEKRTKVQEALSNLNSALTNLVGEPSQAARQNEFAATLQKLRALLSDVRSTFQPAQIKLLEEIGAAKYFAADLASEIAGWVSENVATPAVAQEKLTKLISERDSYLTQIRQLRENLLKVDIKVDGLEPGQAEIGFLLPRELFENQLEPLIKELNVVKRIIRAFSEAATGSVEPIEVRQISTTDPLFFFGLPPETIGMIGAAVTWALLTWKQVEEIRKIWLETQKIDALKNDPIEELFEGKIKQYVEKSVNEHVALISGGIKADKIRKNELEFHLKWALESIISRVERGMVVEIKLLAPPKPEPRRAKNHRSRHRSSTNSRRLPVSLSSRRRKARPFSTFLRPTPMSMRREIPRKRLRPRAGQYG